MAGGDAKGRNVMVHASVARAPMPAGSADDAAILERSFSYPEVFATLFDRHYGAIHGYLARRVGAGRAEDLASEDVPCRVRLPSSLRAVAP
jgi:hypothetical protein